MHGLELSSVDWVINDADKSPPFILVDRGFDVWLGNNRGTDYSLGHNSKSYKYSTYWDFSQEELGLYDDPAFIDFVL